LTAKQPAAAIKASDSSGFGAAKALRNDSINILRGDLDKENCKLKEDNLMSRHTDRFPTPHRRIGYWPVILGSLRFNANPMAEEVDHIERVKSAIVFDISRPQKGRLMDVAEGQRLCEIVILNSLWRINISFD
jgi:hypothetical protein